MRRSPTANTMVSPNGLDHSLHFALVRMSCPTPAAGALNRYRHPDQFSLRCRACASLQRLHMSEMD